MALRGLRLGWAYCPAHVADVLNRIRGPFNVSAAAMAAGVAAINDQKFVETAIAHNEKWLGLLTEQLQALGLEGHAERGKFPAHPFCFQTERKQHRWRMPI